MDGNLKVTPEELRNAANEFSSANANVQNITSEMMSLVKALTSAWEGEASTAYINRFNGLDDDMQKIHKKIQEHVDDLNEMATVYENAEKAQTEANSAVPDQLID